MSDDPKRLLDDPETSDVLRDDLSAVKNADVGYDAEAGLARLQAAIAPQPTGPAPSAGSGAAAAGAGGKLALWLGAAVLAALGAVAIVALTRPEPSKTDRPVVAPIASSAPVVTKPSAPDDVPTVDLSALPVEKQASAPAPSASAPVSAEERLRLEMKDLAEIRAALASNPSQALERANQGHQKFKGGLFYQEREALAISALVALGRSGEAKTRGRQFLVTFPKGPYAERIRRETGL